MEKPIKSSFQAPTPEKLKTLIGEELYNVWILLCQLIEQKYDMERFWNPGGKAWTYEYKYRRGGKTFCALYAKEQAFGFMVILGKNERAKFEMERALFSGEVQEKYNNAATYHDGKWLLLELKDTSLFGDIERFLLLKRRPDKK